MSFDRVNMALTRRELLAVTSTAAAAQAAAGATGTSAEARMTGGRIKAVCFDALTIFDPRSVDAVVEERFPGKGHALAAAWRARQFEYSWLRTLTRTYVDFWQVTQDALVFTFEAAKIDLKPGELATLMNAYLTLKPWSDSAAALKTMRDADVRLSYVSDMTTEMLHTNTERSGLAGLFEHALSTDMVKAFKPDPRAYQMAEDVLDLPRENIVFAAFGGWDAAGAKSFGLNTFWVNRLDAPLEQLGVKPDAVGATLTELARYVQV